MKKYMKPAMKAVEMEYQEMIAQSLSLHDEVGDGPNLSSRFEEGEVLDIFEEKNDLNLW